MRLMALVAGMMQAGAAAAGGEPMDYAHPENWLCRPDARGPCDADLSLSDVSAGGILGVPPPPALPSGFDCFYVYPTVSRQLAGNSDGKAGDDERYVVAQQFARYGEVCRRFAPLYRQSTLASITGRVPGDGELAYGDVKAAWQRYLAADNGGRGVLLVGHSQGARHLARLIAEEIAGKPVAGRIVAAHVIGWPIPVADPDVAGAAAPPLQMLPLCRRANDTGCLVAYVTFAASRPPAPGNRFAGTSTPGLMTACVNPAAVLDTPMLAPILPTRPRAAGSSDVGGQVTLAPPGVTTASYRLSGMVKGACARGEGGTSYLAVSSSAPQVQAGLERIDAALPGWGLHLVDMNIAMGNLVGLARRQGEAFVAKAAAAR
jgi:hypothetical protein